MHRIPIIATYALLLWWVFAAVTDLHWFAPPENKEGAVGQATVVNITLVLLVGVMWIHRAFRR